MYRFMCAPAQKAFFDLFCRQCADPRLALFLVPQRPAITMVRLTRPKEKLADLGAGQWVDFAVELPCIEDGSWCRIAIGIEDSPRGGEASVSDAFINMLNENGWDVRLLSEGNTGVWVQEAGRLATEVQNAIGYETLEAARKLRDLPEHQRQALTDLVLLPIAEAQLTVATARWLYAKGTAGLRIWNPQAINLQPVLESIDECLTNLERLYGLPSLDRPAIVNSIEDADAAYFALPSAEAWSLMEVSNLVVLSPRPAFADYEDPLLSGALPRPIGPEIAEDDDALKDCLTYFLRHVFRKESFREGQIAIVRRALQLQPVVGLLPTAAGKSLCYQMASLLQPGFTIVVQPLRSLMWDQQDNLDAMGIHRSTAIMSYAEVTPDEDVRLQEEGYKAIANGFRFFVFVSPERFQIPGFRKQVTTFAEAYPIPYCVVDEAHCVSEWGHDFRPAYLNLGWLVPRLCSHKEAAPILIALTGTASRNVLTDILRELGIRDPNSVVTPENFDRPELKFEVKRVRVDDRYPTLTALFSQLVGYRPGQPLSHIPSGLVFTYFVNDPQLGAAFIYKHLRDACPGMMIGLYTGGAPYWMGKRQPDKWEAAKLRIQEQFKRNEVPILVCSHSFGMGIDKPDIRFTIHVMLPRSMEEFYQQAGRAGRDGNESHCYIIFADDQPALADEVLDPLRVSVDRIAELVKDVGHDRQSDVLRNTWFLRNSFMGKEKDKQIVDHVWRALSDGLPTRQGDRYSCRLRFDFLPDVLLYAEDEGKVSYDTKQQALEKAIYRLLIIGAVDDYTKDWGKREFQVEIIRHSPDGLRQRFMEYLSRYATEGEIRRYLPRRQPDSYSEAVRAYAHQVVEFVYDRIEQRRRRAMWEMLQIARDAERFGIERFREQINTYMAESKFSHPVKELTKRVSPTEWFDLLSKVEGVDGLVRLFGACRRQIEEFPEHPGLLLLTGFCRLLYGNEGLRDIGGAFFVLRRDYPNVDRMEVARKLVAVSREHFPGKLSEVLGAVLNSDRSREMARFCYAEAPAYSLVCRDALFELANGVLRVLRRKDESDG
ncbi:MAG: DEAD/DEAH box helicase, partial [Armatimonadota bacterium]